MKKQSSLPLLELTDIRKHYPVRKGLFRKASGIVRAVEDVSLAVNRGESVALVGESGSGKSTIARMASLLETPTAGEIRFDGRIITARREKSLREFRRQVQITFQDPYGSLNPRLTIGRAIGEVLRVHHIASGREVTGAVRKLLGRVGLSEGDGNRYPHALSGGQRQRAGLARALAVRPSLVVADEPVSALDVSTQAQVLQLFRELRRTLSIAYLFITHDLAIIPHIADRVIILYAGRIMEQGPVESVYRDPSHPYTKALLDAIPRLKSGRGPSRPDSIGGDIPSPLNPPSGCPFHPRCPLADEECAGRLPELVPTGAGREAACLKLHPRQDDT